MQYSLVLFHFGTPLCLFLASFHKFDVLIKSTLIPSPPVPSHLHHHFPFQIRASCFQKPTNKQKLVLLSVHEWPWDHLLKHMQPLGTHIPEETWLYLLQQSSMPGASHLGSDFRSHFHIHPGVWASLIFCQSCAYSPRHCELMSETVLSHLQIQCYCSLLLLSRTIFPYHLPWKSKAFVCGAGEPLWHKCSV